MYEHIWGVTVDGRNLAITTCHTWNQWKPIEKWWILLSIKVFFLQHLLLVAEILYQFVACLRISLLYLQDLRISGKWSESLMILMDSPWLLGANQPQTIHPKKPMFLKILPKKINNKLNTLNLLLPSIYSSCFRDTGDRWWQLKSFVFSTRILGVSWSNWTHVFQVGWFNHHLEICRVFHYKTSILGYQPETNQKKPETNEKPTRTPHDICTTRGCDQGTTLLIDQRQRGLYWLGTGATGGMPGGGNALINHWVYPTGKLRYIDIQNDRDIGVSLEMMTLTKCLFICLVSMLNFWGMTEVISL